MEIEGPNDFVQDEQNDVTLECNAVGKPSPTIVFVYFSTRVVFFKFNFT